ncbi:MAG: response regulator [Burkholderiaceae bacterium]|nr:MAG: response regulator [Burkholderiaceae bacterium]
MPQRILLLDDEASVLSALQRTLRSALPAGITIETTVDPEIALGRLRETAFDVVVSDFRMPLMTGSEFLGLVRAIQPHAVRMILSASSDSGTIVHALNEVEVFRYLIKPWVDSELAHQFRQALGKAEEAQRERELADVARVQFGEISAAEAERRRLEAMEPGITQIELGPQGEVLPPRGM